MSEKSLPNNGLSPEKAALLEQLLADHGLAPEAARSKSNEHLEEALCSVWSDVFARAVLPEDDFFQLGGDSILAMRLASLARSRGLRLEGADILLHGSVRALADAGVVETIVEGASPTTRADAQASFSLPMTAMHQAILYQVQVSSLPSAYISQFVCRLPDDLASSAFDDAWHELTARYSALRAAVEFSDDGRPTWRVEQNIVPDITHLDWSDRDQSAADRSLQMLAKVERKRGFDLQRAPLSRLVVALMPDGAMRCIWTHHHLLFDGWSQMVILRAFFDRIASQRPGERGGDRELLQEFSASIRLDLDPAARSFWKGHLSDVNPCSFAPANDADKAPVEHVRFKLGRELTEQLLSMVGEAGTTLAAACELFWGTALSVIFDRDAVTFGIVSSTRPAMIAVDELAWLCINTLPTRIAIHGNHTTAKGGLAARLDSHGPVHAQRMRHVGDPIDQVMRANPHAAFGSVLVVQNFRGNLDQLLEEIPRECRPSEVQFFMREYHPLVCIVEAGDDGITIEIKADHSWALDLQAEEIAALVQRVIELTMGDPTLPLTAVRECLKRERARARRVRSWTRLGADRTSKTGERKGQGRHG